MTDDMQEALSIKYNSSRILRLSSGTYALFAPWTNAEGMPMIHIGTLAELADLIPSANECESWVQSITPLRETQPSTMDLGRLLGITRPTIKIERRI